MEKRTGIILIVLFILLIPMNIFGEEIREKTIIISLDELSFSDIENLESEELAVGLMNLKSRKPYDDENLYLSLNVGRKISRKDILKDELNLRFLGDLLEKEKPYYLGEGGSHIKALIQSKDGKAEGLLEKLVYEDEWFKNRIDSLMEDRGLLAIELARHDNASEIIKYMVENRSEKLIVIPRKVAEEDSRLINNYLVPVLMANNGQGIITSKSTKREGIIALEDISAEIKTSYGYDLDQEIGRSFIIKKEADPRKSIGRIYDGTVNLLVIATIGHGLVYISLGLLFIYILTGRLRRLTGYTVLFGLMNILGTFILAIFGLETNLLVYLIILFILNHLLVKFIKRKDRVIDLTIMGIYSMIVVGMLFKPDWIYSSYLGFNNLIYGARFYGLNNGIVGVLLVASILIIDSMDRYILDGILKKVLILILPIINIVTLSTRFGTNTGGFITSIFLLLGVIYFYLLPDRLSRRNAILFLILGVSIFGINIYIDEIAAGEGHALQFINRFLENGFSELVYMFGFKFKELIKLTLMPPFSLVLLVQIYMLRRLYINRKDVNLIIGVALIGYIINDTGNILLIYMLYFLIFKLYIEKSRSMIH